MRPDQSHALFERQRRRQDSFGLARENPAKCPTGGRVKENLNAFVEKRARRNSPHEIGDVHLARDGFRGRRVRDSEVRDG